MKKLLTILLVFTMIVPCFAVLGTSVNAAVSSEGRLPFEDIPSNHWSLPYAEFCYANGYIAGQGNNYTFAPDAKLTRATFVVILARVLKADLTAYTWSTFSDCAKGTWYTPSVMWASENGYVNGTGNGKFSPDANMNREQAAVMFARILSAMGYAPENTNEYLKYSDIYTASDWAVDSIKYIINMGIMSSTNSNKFTFSPNTVMTRAQIAKMFTTFMSDYSSCRHRTRTTPSCVKGDWCRGCGLKFTLANGHNVPSLSCIQGGTCTTCGTYVSADKELHSYTAPTCTTGSACTLCGNVRNDALGHTTTFGICTRCNAEVFKSEYLRLAYYMSKKASSNGKGVYTWTNTDYQSQYTATTKITYNANNASFNLYYKYRDVNSSYIEYNISIPKVSTSYAIDFTYISTNGTQIAKGNGSVYTNDASYQVYYNYNTSFTQTEINEDIEATYELMIIALSDELAVICNTSLYAFGFFA